MLGFVGPGVRPAANWLSATVPYLSRAGVAAAVAPKMAPTSGTLLERGAAAVCESRFGGGALYFRHTPGNLRFVSDFPDETIVVRRDRFLELGDVALDDVCTRLVEAGERRRVHARHRARGSARAALTALGFVRPRPTASDGGATCERELRGLRLTTLLPVALLLFLVAAPVAFLIGGAGLRLWLAAAIAYGAALLAGGILAALKFRSAAVGAVTVVGLVGTHVAFGAGFLRGLIRR